MKVIELLSSFSRDDWHWLKKLVNSPVYNQNEGVSRIFEIFRKQQDLTKKSYSSEKIHELLHPELPYNAAKIHHTTNYFLGAVEDFLAWDEWWKDDSEQQRYLLQAFRKRGLNRFFHEKIEKMRANMEKQPLRHAEHYRFRYRLALEDYHFSMQNGRSAAEQLQPLADWHDIAFISEKLKNACGLVSRQRVLRMELDLGMLPYVLDFVRARPQMLQHAAIAVYYHGYLALSNPDRDEHFFALKAQLSASADQFPVEELRDIYLLAINFCIHRINLREDAYLREVFELYKNGLNFGVFYDNGQVSRFTYTNIALAGLRLQEFSWVYEFLHRYKEKLPETQRQGTFAFNIARYYCERGDYGQAMPLLLEMDFDDVLHNLTAKAMLVKMYFETETTAALDSLLASLGAYLRRKRQVSEQQRTAYQNFIRFVRRLGSLPRRDKAGRGALLAEINETSLVAEKDWLLRQARG